VSPQISHWFLAFSYEMNLILSHSDDVTVVLTFEKWQVDGISSTVNFGCLGIEY